MTWEYPSGSAGLFTAIGICLVIGFAFFFAVLNVPARARRWVVAAFTFVAGAIYVLQWLWPSAQDRNPGDIPNNAVEGVSFWIEDVVGQFKSLSNTLTAFLLLLGVFSLIRLHLMRVAKKQRDWPFSIVLLVSALLMAAFGYADWHMRLSMQPDQLEAIKEVSAWPVQTLGKDILFNGLLQTMEAAMFSIIAFYILSAAYRAFRIRSVEATILLASALIVMLGLLGVAETFWSVGIDKMGGSDPQSFVNNFRLDSISGFLRDRFQAPGLRAIDFGVGVGALAMGLRLWLSLERGGTSS
jgi:hypothetical protein